MTTAIAPQVLVRGPGLTPRALSRGPLLWVVRAPAPDTPLDLCLLDAEERRRAAALRRPAERALYVAAHSALRRVLSAYTGLPAAAIRLTRLACPGCGGPHGRPAVAGPAGDRVHYSLSHTGGLALLGLASRPVGVDVERVPEPTLAEEAGRSLHPCERQQLTGTPPAVRAAAFARCWSRKEAYLKATGEGVSLDALRDVYAGAGFAPAQPAGWRVADVEVPVGWAAACVVSVPGAPRVRRPVPCASRGNHDRR
ncbi:4'-phosphopantetheinyl transferase family protein [Streptomyces justiciae]|uniref:4'-phosphopantetheinyl transferase superfamily protein n=1 Tax=Streptomyces justiciae TaxID=2780140 RepID=A0ABU3M3K0_9ACTN|nr:4'-phosphopantetheinyl transferase superfamily protein [Streptomyces justiciae]MDT7845606.1 4'-phosphopantetheinyl transferase superfamily protein [Streptomyces justiciae]